MGELAFLYHQGAMVNRDYETALMWALTSDTFGNRNMALGFSGDDDLTYYTEGMNSEAQMQAQKRADVWKAEFDEANPDYEIELLQ